MSSSASKYVFFWRQTEEEAGWASQWYQRPCTSPSPLNASDTVAYPTAEHYMMYHKALLFDDSDIATQILAATTPIEVKALGRQVKNFDDEIWKENRYRIVKEGNILKFTQHSDLKEKLLATKGKMLVEASPRDRIWGIGYGAKNALANKERWGLNLLGLVLVEIRDEMLDEQDVEVVVEA